MNIRPFPEDPQWREISRKLPPDAVVACLLRFGFRPSDIADRFDVAASRVAKAARRAGVPPVRPGSTVLRRNGAPLSHFERIAYNPTPNCAIMPSSQGV